MAKGKTDSSMIDQTKKSPLERWNLYFAAGLGGFLMGLMDVILRGFRSEDIESALIFKIGDPVGKVISHILKFHTGTGSGIGEAAFGLGFLIFIALVYVYVKTPGDKWDSFVAGFAAFALMSSLVPTTQLKDITKQNQPVPNEERIDDPLTMIDSSINSSRDKSFEFSVISSAMAQSENIEPGEAESSNYLLYLKGGKYGKAKKTIVEAYKDEELVGRAIYTGSREKFVLESGLYRFNVYVQTYKRTEFQFITIVNVSEQASGGYINIEESNLKPVGVLSKILRSYEEVSTKPLNQYELNKQLGIYSSIQKDYLGAISYYDEALKGAERLNLQNNNIVKVMVLKGYSYFRSQMFEQAEKELRMAYSLESNDIAWINLLKVMCAQKEYENARNLYLNKADIYTRTVERDGEFRKICSPIL